MIVGIDLGTTNSLVAWVNREGKPEIVINERGSRLTPSVVQFKNDQEVIVGEMARNQALLQADRTVSSIKRYMGSDFEVDISGRQYSPVEISALIIRKLIQYAEKVLNEKVEAAVVTVPAYFNDNQRQATFMAGELAGIKIVKLLNEPTAAALAYASELANREHILVLDIGGGTFDITLMEYEGGVCRVLCTGGSSSLGGLDFDQRLGEHICTTFEENNGVNLQLDLVAMQQVQINAEKSKLDLSTVKESSILIPYISISSNGPLHLKQVIQREQFNYLCSHLLQEIEDLIRHTLVRAEVDREWVDVVVFAGGSSRMPGFREKVEQIFPGVEIRTEINPDEVVALGAALEAAMLAGQVNYVELHDVTSHTLGIEDNQGEFVPLIAANTTYPVLDSKLFTTVEDQQEEVIIHILQRDEMGDSEGDDHTISLGKFHLSGIRKAGVGEANIDVSFEIDKNGILHVSAMDIDTGIQNQVEIDDLAYLSGSHVLARRGRNLTVL
ncbi:MAG: Hsp70 family protein [Syntrophomonadaceae bacterium]|nr:Hsp70 family protein [Syntrophomonadaceae bacterium]